MYIHVFPAACCYVYVWICMHQLQRAGGAHSLFPLRTALSPDEPAKPRASLPHVTAGVTRVHGPPSASSSGWLTTAEPSPRHLMLSKVHRPSASACLHDSPSPAPCTFPLHLTIAHAREISSESSSAHATAFTHSQPSRRPFMSPCTCRVRAVELRL